MVIQNPNSSWQQAKNQRLSPNIRPNIVPNIDLDRNRLVVQWQFLDKNRAGDDTWATEQQLSITDELSYSDTVNGIMVGIKPEGIHVVGSPPDVAWKPCPK